jgi:PadR family transcriptional regulator PadR
MLMTYAVVKVAMALAADPAGRHWGYSLSRQAGVRSGVLYPLLTRMLNEGWLSDGWEDPASIESGRPPRRYYVVTPEGRKALTGLLDEAREDPRFSALLQTEERRT